MGTATKALSLLGYFTQQRTHIGLSEFARISGMNKATVFRHLSELQAGGFVEQIGTDKSYRLGSEILRLAKLREAAVPLLSIARPILRRICAETGETSHFALVQQRALVSVAHAYSQEHATRVMMEDAEILPFHATSSGRAVLAYINEATASEILKLPMDKFTSSTITDAKEIRDLLPDIRERGYAIQQNSFEQDVFSCGSPVFDAEAQPIGAISVAAPVSRAEPENPLGQAVLRAAREITLETGGVLPSGFPQPEN